MPERQRHDQRPMAPMPMRASPRPSSSDQQRVGADVQVLQHPVALAVIEHRLWRGPRCRRPRTPTARCRRPRTRRYSGSRAAAADDLEHDHQDQHRGDRLGDRVDEEQERVGPVGLDRPAQARPRCGSCAARRGALPCGGRGGARARRRAGRVGVLAVTAAHAPRTVSRPSWRASRSSFRSSMPREPDEHARSSRPG